MSQKICSFCGARYDDSEKTCPYCGTECPPAEDDWIIQDVKNVGKKYAFKRLFWAFVIIALAVLMIYVTITDLKSGYNR